MHYSTAATALIVAAATAAPALAAPLPQAGDSYDLVQRDVNNSNLWERTLAALGLSARADEVVTELVARAFGRKSPHPEPFWGTHHSGHSTSGHTSDHSGHSGAGEHSGGGGDHGDSSGGQTRRSDDGAVELIARARDGRKSTAPEQYYPSHHGGHSGHSGDHSSSQTRSDDGELLARVDDEDVFARFDDDGLFARHTHTGKPVKSDTTFPTEHDVPHRPRSYDQELLARFDDELVARADPPFGFKPRPKTSGDALVAYMRKNHGTRSDDEELMARFDDELVARNTHTGKPPKPDTTFPTEHGGRVRSHLRSYDDDELLA
ncbi:hypothetical protein C8Q72DRAFT_380607 [Fomitopsis betulina]|nr:hypothetical protein C8Q72DRAFT_380607 [Fomitopsis betulina]